jgi:ATP/ADP translocase
MVGAIYAVFIFIVATKRKINPWGWVIGSLIPFVGLLVGLIFFFTTLLSMLDRLNALEATARTDAFT